MPSKAETLQMYADMGTWRKVSRALGLASRTVHRWAKDPDYEPKRRDIRIALGLEVEDTPKVTYIRQVRNDKGRFA